MQIIIFSFDRAMQLEATLKSFFLHCKDLESAKTTVIYRTSDKDSTKRYEKLGEVYSSGLNKVHFLPENDFRWDVLRVLLNISSGTLFEKYHKLWARMGYRFGGLSNLWLGGSFHEYVLFLVDDNLFTQDFSLREVKCELEAHPEAVGFSLRLGSNIRYSYMQNTFIALPPFNFINEKMIQFTWVGQEADFGYPLEISSSIYRLRDLLPILTCLPFKNPNLLEGKLALHADAFQRKSPTLLCYATSIAFCNPINKVQLFNDNRAGDRLEYSPQNLGKLFDESYRIDVHNFSGFIPFACHQEVGLIFKKLESTT